MVNTKTPVMVLQELSVKRGWEPPQYNLIHSKREDRNDEFHYAVKLLCVVKFGVGRSKQLAKHDAARNALEFLMTSNLCTPDEIPGSEAVSCPIKLVNAITDLNNICTVHKIPVPTFKEISVVGPPHCKEFTYSCEIGLIMTKATAGSKQQAKQFAAKEMLDRLDLNGKDNAKDKHCEINVVSFTSAITEQSQKTSESYVQPKKCTKPKIILALKIKDFDEKEMNLKDIIKCLLQEPTEENLKMFLDKLGLEFDIEILTETPYLVALTLNTNVPFTVLERGNCYFSCVDAVLKKTFMHLDALLA